ncbi:MAG: tryptophan synthase subunit alpha [Candidatus Dormibacteria bacterium]
MASRPAGERLASAFAAARTQRRALLIGYLVAGDPDPTTTELMVAAIADAGLDVLELGLPYGDPIADGPTIAQAAQRALDQGFSIGDYLGAAERAAARLPVVLFTYYNPIHSFGVNAFALRAGALGADGVIVPDLSLEEASPLREALLEQGLAMPLLVAPTTPSGRAGRIVSASSGFVYLVSRRGVTGESQGPGRERLEQQLRELRQGPLPVAVGFGISRPGQVSWISARAEGVIVGSALVASPAGARGMEAARRAAQLVDQLRPALARPRPELSPAASPPASGAAGA